MAQTPEAFHCSRPPAEHSKVIRSLWGERDGILIPRSVGYWFEQAGDGPAEVLHVAVISDAMGGRRVGEPSGSMKRL